MPRANAAIGLATGNAGLAIAGLGVFATGQLFSATVYDGGFMAKLGLIWGVVMLDGEEQEVQFNTITDSEALELGMTEAEFHAYNENIDQLSLVANEIATELEEDSTLEDSKILWNTYSEFLDADAYSAAQKLIQ